MLGGLLAVVMVLAIIAACFLVFFIICAHFYRNLMTDEGYLTFTLPVKTSEILWSKLITAMLWTIISVVVIGLCVLMFVGLSTAASFGAMRNSFSWRMRFTPSTLRLSCSSTSP